MTETNNTSDEGFVSIDAMSRHLSVSISTIRAWVRSGVVTPDAYLRIGHGPYRFHRSTVIADLKNATEHEVADTDENQLEMDFEEPQTEEK